MPSNTWSTVIIICITIGLVVIVPVVTLTGRSDNVVQEEIQLALDELVTDVVNTGKLTRDMYLDFVSELNSTGNTYEVEIEIQQVDDSQGIKTSLANSSKDGENQGVTIYTTQVLNQLGIKVDDEEPSENDTILLGEGWTITMNVKSSNPTTNQTLESSFLGVSNADESAITARSSARCTVNGANN